MARKKKFAVRPSGFFNAKAIIIEAKDENEVLDILNRNVPKLEIDPESLILDNDYTYIELLSDVENNTPEDEWDYNNNPVSELKELKLE